MIKETLERLSSPTPKYFKKLIKVCVSVGSAGAALLGAPAAIAASGVTIALPHILTTIAGYMIAAGVVGGAFSKLTVDDAAINGSQSNPETPL